ncbi:leucyl aminopeptidase family protein [Phaeovulum vinaykumarii]|uniref:Leucyl aminopeptidase n=1 Tax=Phaeovulum vinaykumarii TaxID=407234 RepID=A0A1N7L0H8_9RHOB|nr:leucyl aminopeptidase family protein [Phaeovulum vinaykumarii]SIS67334.1 leucyl aminopeptidase [Phaeovulum vinaykumarii]SOC00751.1 leucyl aminopeptidase [Phaeovulum vinaykumarii]
MNQRFAPADADSLPLILVPEGELPALLPEAAAWVAAQEFTGKLGQICVLPGPGGAPSGALFGMGTARARARGRFHLARAADALPEGTWHLEGTLDPAEASEAALGWLLAGYRFARYKSAPAPRARLKCPPGVDADRLEMIAAGEALTRDLINTPARDMGPDELQAAMADLAQAQGASLSVTMGGDLETGFPMIAAVGAASPRAPRLLDLRWGTTGPRLTLVGKGVCFDTGGLDLKPSSSMGLMKKDMGGAATVLGLARMIMGLGLPLRLRVLVPAVENAVSGAAMRPGDVLPSRKGLTVEVNNTDAEGRLVLADALALADEEAPDLLICMATLTGAARVALGPDVVPFYTDDTALAESLTRAGQAVADPLWRMPFWAPYETLIEPAIADLDNAPSGGMAGSITAALFLRRFVTDAPRFAHFDIYGWQPTAAPGRPKGGVGQAARALLEALPGVLKL